MDPVPTEMMTLALEQTHSPLDTQSNALTQEESYMESVKRDGEEEKEMTEWAKNDRRQVDEINWKKGAVKNSCQCKQVNHNQKMTLNHR